jgi:hypothetical protein
VPAPDHGSIVWVHVENIVLYSIATWTIPQARDLTKRAVRYTETNLETTEALCGSVIRSTKNTAIKTVAAGNLSLILIIKSDILYKIYKLSIFSIDCYYPTLKIFFISTNIKN